MFKTKKTAKQAYADFEKWLDRKDSAAPNPWCPAGVAGCALGYGYFTGAPKKIWNCSVWVSIAKAAKTWRGAETNTGKFGDAVIFDWSGKKTTTDHIGFLIKEDKKFVWHISANSRGGLVRINKTSKKYIMGYGTVIKFAEETTKPVAAVKPVETTKPVAKVPTKPAASKPAVEPTVASKPIKIANPKPVIPATAKPTQRFQTIEKGDSYWAIARRELGVPNTPVNYARIAALSGKIQVLNKKKALVAGQSVRVK
jgi:hypothetical protein